MGEENKFEFTASQNSTLPSSQESVLFSPSVFEALWEELVLPNSLINPNDLSNPNAVINDVNLDSCNLSNAANEQQTISDENNHENHAVLPSVQLTSQIVSVVSNATHASSSLPASENWPGLFDFKVSFSPQNKDTKGVAWTYSEIKDKLYVGKDVPCPINFSANTVLPNDVFIRVMALYSSPEQVSEIVHRCVNHSMEEIHNGRKEAEHLIRCESSTANYHVDASSGRHSVVVPFENPAAGQQYSTYIYKFACFGSCAGGPNRRPLMLIFTLERGHQVIGRRKLDVKICACPGRDRKTDEAQSMPNEIAPQEVPVKRRAQSDLVNLSDVLEFSKSVYLPPPKKSKVGPNEDGVYVLNVEDRECFEFLRQMKRFYDMCKFMKSLPPDAIMRARHHMQKKREE